MLTGSTWALAPGSRFAMRSAVAARVDAG